MTHKKFRYKKWYVKYIPEDGARLSQIRFGGFNLITTEPASFNPPKEDYGLYEMRPVYGYDDCFPSVKSCTYPGKDWIVPDHGELCWLPWHCEQRSDRLSFSVHSQNLPILFNRELVFKNNTLTWNFEVHNSGRTDIPFQHIIHPMIPLNKIKKFSLPDFESVYDAMNEKILDLQTPADVNSYLLSKEKGTADMLFIQHITGNEIGLTFTGDMNIRITFPAEHFNTIGIWWNNNGYPDEKGCRRNECGFEPITGLSNDLSAEYDRGKYLVVKPGKSFIWTIKWQIE